MAYGNNELSRSLAAKIPIFTGNFQCSNFWLQLQRQAPHGEIVWQKIGSDFREILFQKRWLKRNVRHLCRTFLLNLRFWNNFFMASLPIFCHLISPCSGRPGLSWILADHFNSQKRTFAAKRHYISHISLSLFWSQVGFCVTKDCHCILPQHSVAAAGWSLYLYPQWVVDRPEHNSARILCGM